MQNSTQPTVEGATADRRSFADLHAELAAAGYVDLPEHNGIKVGARVRHVGHQWPSAFTEGSAVVRAVMGHGSSRWARSYGRPDVEVIIEFDKGGPHTVLDGCLTYVADYHVELTPALM